MPNPIISVIMPSYNHGPFLAATVESVLAQKSVDFELLIEDDGSTDDSHTRLEAYLNNPLIQIERRQKNLGGAATLNNLIQRAKGSYIALINSDDAWASPHKLAHQLNYLETHPDVGVCFGRARYIDAAGRPMDKQSIYLGTIFDEPNHSRAGWLRRFFLLGNCLCHPTMLIRRACYDAVGLYDNSLRQVPDFEMWIRIVKRFGMHILDEELIEFRLREGENTSAPTVANSLRVQNEYFLIYSNLLDDIEDVIFIEAFSDMLDSPELTSPKHVCIQKTLLYLKENQWLATTKYLIGIRRLHALMRDPDYSRILRHDFGITDKWFHDINSKQSPFCPQYVYVNADKATHAPTKSFPFLRYLSLFRRQPTGRP